MRLDRPSPSRPAPLWEDGGWREGWPDTSIGSRQDRADQVRPRIATDIILIIIINFLQTRNHRSQRSTTENSGARC